MQGAVVPSSEYAFAALTCLRAAYVSLTVCLLPDIAAANYGPSVARHTRF